MAFFTEEAPAALSASGLSKNRLALLHRHECQVCPLYHMPGYTNTLRHPQMPASGAEHPLLYIMAEAPGAEEDKQGIQLIGPSGQVLRFRIPKRWLPKIRWNNVIRCRPPENRDPSPEEIEACRPSIIRDIEASKPKAILGLGNFPLHWAIEKRGVTLWTGRRIPIKVGEHTCWFYPIVHPSYVLRSRKFVPSSTDQYGCNEEVGFAHDIRRVLEEVETLPEPVVHNEAMTREGIEIVTGARPGDLQRVLNFLKKAVSYKLNGWDLETDGLRPYRKEARILTMAVSHQHGTMAFAIHHRQAGWSQDDKETLLKAVGEYLRDPHTRKAAHNLPFELEWSGVMFGQDLIHGGKWGCSQSQSYILDERPNTHSLDFLCLQYFGFNLKSLSTVNVKNLDADELEPVLRYNGLDAKYHRLLYVEQSKRIVTEGLHKIYQHQMRRIKALVLTSIKGVPVHNDTVEYFYKKYSKDLLKVEEQIRQEPTVRRFSKIKGHEFRPSSLHDVSFAIYKIIKAYGRGTDEQALSRINHKLARLVLRWRKINKQLSTYIRPMREEAGNVFNGVVHPTYGVTSTRTWRTSSADPNIQNQPKHGKHKIIRRQVRPGDANLRMVAVDYSGIQARNIAMESKDKRLVRAFWSGYDIHGEWAKRIARHCPGWLKGGTLEDPDTFKVYRQKAKNGMVFASFFGAGAKTVAGHLGIAEDRAAVILEEFWRSFPEIKNWHNELKNNYHACGYVQGLSGYRRRAPVSYNEMINSPIQADEAIIICEALESLSEMDDPLLQPNIEIHDDLTFIMPKDKIDHCVETIVKEMLTVRFSWINVPLAVEVSVGEDWYDMSRYGEFSSDKLGLGPEKPEWVK